MEFMFRAGDQRPPPPPRCASPRLPPVYCLSKQGFPGDECVRTNTNMIAMRNPFDTNEAVRHNHQMELILLREEKLMLEIQRQRFLIEEARRELTLLEREMAIRGVSQSAFTELSRWGMLAPVAVVRSFNEQQKVGELRSLDRIGFSAVSLPPRVQPLMSVGKKEGQVLQADKKELVVLEKPDPNVFREKRKAETPLISSNDIQPFDVMKNPNEEWSCTLCQVTATSEITLKQHLRGKKHKRKEEGLRTQKVSKVSQATPVPLPNKRRKLHRATKASGSSGAKEQESKVGETLECEKLDAKEDKQENELMIELKLISKNVIVGKKKFKFWCEKCKVGAFATEVMFNHLNGKKHKANHQEAES